MTSINKNIKNEAQLNFLKRFILPIMSTIAISVFPPLFLYFQNANEANFADVIFPILLFVGTGIIIFSIFLIIYKNNYKAAVISSIFNFIFLNYSLIESIITRIFPMLRYWHIVLILAFFMGHIVWILLKKISPDLIHIITSVIFFVFSGLILFNAIIATPKIINKISYIKLTEQKLMENQIDKEKEFPNIYYLILDEYSSINFIKKYYNYDNTNFTNYLKKLGFNVSLNSYNESIMTSTVTANLLNLDYLVHNNMPESEKNYYRKNNFLFEFLGDKGYKIVGLGNSEAYGLKNASFENSSPNAKTIEGKTITDIIFSKTIIKPFYNISYNKSVDAILNTFKYLKDPSNYSENTFTFCHLVCPHEPFYFNKHGNVYKNPNSNWKDPKYYLGQYIFTTNQITEIIDSIVTNDPNSCIIIQSDHSARASSDPELFLEIFDLEDISNIFNAVYYKGKELNIEGLSGVNTLRLLLNKVFGENFEIINVPIDNYKYK